MDHLTGMRVFVRVAELGSFSRAAEDLEIAQSTVTKTIAWLETRLGTRLINRNTRGIGLNEAGRLYYETCRSILRQIEEAEGLVRGHDAELDGTLRISTSVAFGEAVIGPMLLPFIQANPRLKVDLTCEDSYVDLIARGIDVALRMGRLADSSLGGRYLGANPWVMVAAPGYLARHGRPDAPDQLSEHDCVVYSSVQGDAVWQMRGADGRTHAVSVRGCLRSNNLPTLLSAVRSGLGIAILPRYVAEAPLRSGELTECLPGFSLPDQELYAVFPSPKLVPRKVTALIRHLVPRLRDAWWRDGDGTVDLFPERINQID
ncbi:LysR family transcriptional regulator [Methylobacterium sp. J-068]|uniref:LysR family transcriptional regulator n=1 Tax=Methylobacterium sp. J-068 TaxID=2836649 RepID=UPI001FBA985B|nr:LysR family transcriptional regulator [Methylobacterium sp. J-068]MCJ2034515.1 LysR family transcriptional regulator [Methylobacterium sp. J-068]